MNPLKRRKLYRAGLISTTKVVQKGPVKTKEEPKVASPRSEELRGSMRQKKEDI